MQADRKAKSIEASFKMEDMSFDSACRERVKNILDGDIAVSDALEELNQKYGVSQKKNERPRV